VDQLNDQEGPVIATTATSMRRLAGACRSGRGRGGSRSAGTDPK